MVNYQNGKIYKIVSESTDKIYVGSTALKYLSSRLVQHKKQFKQWQKGKGDYVTSYDLLQNNDYKIILLETYPCNTKDELRSKEQEYIDKFKAICINKKLAYTGLTKKEYMQEFHKEYNKRIIFCNYCGHFTNKSHYSHHCKIQKHITNVEYWNNYFENEFND